MLTYLNHLWKAKCHILQNYKHVQIYKHVICYYVVIASWDVKRCDSLLDHIRCLLYRKIMYQNYLLKREKKKKNLFDRSPLSSVSTDYNLFQRQPILQHLQIAIPFEKLLGKSDLTHFSIVLHLNIKGMGGVKVSWVCLDQSQALLVLWKPCRSITLAPVNRHSC